MAIVAFILFPVFARARASARRSNCQSNLKQIGLGFAKYIADYDSRYPYPTDTKSTSTAVAGGSMSMNPADLDPAESHLWMAKLNPYTKSKQIFVCPDALTIASPLHPTGTDATGSAALPKWIGYGYNGLISGFDPRAMEVLFTYDDLLDGVSATNRVMRGRQFATTTTTKAHQN